MYAYMFIICQILYSMQYEFHTMMYLFFIQGPEKLVQGGKLSFPSGHSAGSFASGTFVFLQLALAFQKFYHPLLLMLSMIFPIICAGSRYVDGYHHLHDICIGSVIGIFIGYYTFNCMIRTSKRSNSEIDEIDTNETLLYR